DDRAHAAAGYHAGTVAGWAQQDVAGTVAPLDVERDGAVGERHADQRFLRRFDRLANGLRHLFGLAEAEAHPAVEVADHHQRAEAEAPAALDHLGNAVDVHHLLFELDALDLDSFAPAPDRHVRLLRTSGRRRAHPRPPLSPGRDRESRCGRTPPG